MCLPIKVDGLEKVTVMILFPLKGHGENRRLQQSDRLSKSRKRTLKSNGTMEVLQVGFSTYR
jgi:hypothetical protein